MIATELNTGALKLHRDRYDDTTESTLVNILWACEERDTYLIGEVILAFKFPKILYQRTKHV